MQHEAGRLEMIPEAWGSSVPTPGASGSGWWIDSPRDAMAQCFLLRVPCLLFFQLLPWPLATPTSTTPWQCPPGEEPSLVSSPCPSALSWEGSWGPGAGFPGSSGLAPGFVLTLSLLQDPGQSTLCRSCPPGTFSSSWGSSPCQSHFRCSLRGRLEARAGTVTQDTLCGACQPG